MLVEEEAERMPLGDEIQLDIKLAINCTTERPDAKDSKKKRMIGGGGLRPLFDGSTLLLNTLVAY